MIILKKSRVKDLTIGAMFAAIYGVILLTIRYIFVDSESIIYYLIPVPVAIYVVWKDYKAGILVFITSALISLLIIDPYRALMLYIPNLVLGFVIGVLSRRVTFTYTLLFSFIVALGVDIISIYAFELITGLPYIDSILNEISGIAEGFNISGEVLYNIGTISLAITLVIDSIVKVIFAYILVRILLMRLKIVNVPISINLKPSKIATLISLLLTVIGFLMVSFGLANMDEFLKVIMIIVLSLVFALDLYILSVFLITIGRKLKEKGKTGLAIIVMLIGLLLSPIGYLAAVIYNLTLKVTI